jgi:aminomethyltransferase
MQKFRIKADRGVDFLENIFPGNAAKIRFCRVLHTFLSNEDGELIADCYIANNDEDFIVLCESIVDDAALIALMNKYGAQDAGLEDITKTHVVVSIDGHKAWAVVKELFGADVLGLPYLSIETYRFEEMPLSLLRAGKTSEFGYLLLAPREIAPALLKKLLEVAQKHDGGLCASKIHDVLRLEGRFFNIFAEGSRVKDPLGLGLQWMMDFDKETFIGREPILQKRAKGLTQKIIGVKADPCVRDLKVGTPIFNQGKQVAVVEASCFSYVLNTWIGLALFPVEIAYPYLSFQLEKPDGAKIETISMPPIMPKSLSVKLDEL